MLANIQDGIISDDLPYLKEMNPKYEKYCIKNGSLVISKKCISGKNGNCIRKRRKEDFSEW